MAAWEVTVTVVSGKVASDLTGFPLFIDLANMPANFWSNVNTGGGDIRAFVGPTQLPVDVVTINIGANTGILFVKTPLAAASNTVITILGDGVSSADAATDPYGRNAVWSDYIVVYWPIGGTYNRVNGTARTTLGTAPSTFSGQYELYGANGQSYWTGLTHSTIWTMSWQAFVTTPAGSNDAVAGISNVVTPSDRATSAFRNTPNIGVWDSASGWLSGGTPIANTNYLGQFGYNGASGRKARVSGGSFINLTGGSNLRPSASTGGSGFTVGAATTNDTTERLAGGVRFAWLRNQYMSNDWLNAEYDNISAPSTFYGTIVEASPSVNDITPNIGSELGGTSVTISGSLLDDATGVLFDGNAATSFVVVNSTTITCDTPAGTVGLVDVVVEHPDGDITVTDGFEYISAVSPEITDITPNEGLITGGTAVTVTGTGFTGSTSIEFDGVPATSFVVVNDTTITCVTPAGSTPGLVDVEVFHPIDDYLFVDGFTYLNEARVTQIPLLVIHKPVQTIRITQIPLLVVSLPIQATRVTQIPILPIWTPKPIPLPMALVPDVPVTEIWQWLTVVQIAGGSKEQRSALRSDPRVLMKLSIPIESDDDRMAAFQLLSKYIKTDFDYPLYQYSAKLTAGATAGATKLFFNPVLANSREGELLALYDIVTDETTYVTTTTLDADGANLSSPLLADVPAYVRVCPAIRFHTTPVVGLTMSAIDGVLNLDLTSMGVRSTVRPDAAPTITTYDGFTVLDKRPLANTGVDEVLDQNVDWLDSSISAPEPKTYWPVPLISGQRRYLIHRPEGLDYWGAVANTLNGRQKTFLVPTFRNDLELASAPALSATHIVTTNVQYWEFWRYKTWQYLEIETANGIIRRKVLEAIVNFDVAGDPVSVDIKLDTALGGSAGDNDIRRISYMHLCRMNKDEVSLEHGSVDTVLTIEIRAVNE